MSNKAEQKRRQAFIDEILAVQKKHGYVLSYIQAPVQVQIVPMPTKQPQETPK